MINIPIRIKPISLTQLYIYPRMNLYYSDEVLDRAVDHISDSDIITNVVKNKIISDIKNHKIMISLLDTGIISQLVNRFKNSSTLNKLDRTISVYDKKYDKIIILLDKTINLTGNFNNLLETRILHEYIHMNAFKFPDKFYDLFYSEMIDFYSYNLYYMFNAIHSYTKSSSVTMVELDKNDIVKFINRMSYVDKNFKSRDNMDILSTTLYNIIIEKTGNKLLAHSYSKGIVKLIEDKSFLVQESIVNSFAIIQVNKKLIKNYILKNDYTLEYSFTTPSEIIAVSEQLLPGKYIHHFI